MLSCFRNKYFFFTTKLIILSVFDLVINKVMKRHLLKALLIVVIFIAGCSDDESAKIQQTQGLSNAVSGYLLLKYGGQIGSTSLESNMAGPANNSFTSMLGNFGFTGGRLDSVDVDTIIYDDPWKWTTCAVVTVDENANGSTSETYDYGDGCFEGNDEYQYWVQGKYTSTYQNQYEQNGDVFLDDYFYSILYDNYGGTYYGSYYEGGESSWSTNGHSHYSGNSTYDEATGVFSGEYEYNSEVIYKWDEAKYFSKSLGSSKYDEDKFIIEGINEYESINDPYSTNDNYYKSEILDPLVYDYSCYQNYYSEEGFATSSHWFFAYVSGIEAIDFRENGVAGSFIIDYGNGSCDNLVTIIEEGIEYEIDIVEFYQNSASQLQED